MNSKTAIWILLALALIVTPLVFVWNFVFPLGSSMFGMLSFVMLAFFAFGFVLLYAKFGKVKRQWTYMVVVFAAILGPLIYAYTQVFPLLSANFGWMLILMHFVFAAGLVTAYSLKNKR